MPKGPRGERRKADLNQRAFQIVQIATGEVEEKLPSPKGRAGGKVGGKARAEALTSAEKREIASKAAKSRWGRKRQS